MLSKQNGSALWETLPVLALVIFLVSAFLLTSYLMFARAYILYQAEQALYCVAEQAAPGDCRAQLRARVTRTLPWGDLRIDTLEPLGHGAWMVAHWRLAPVAQPSLQFQLKVRRKLDLSTSKYSRLYL